MGRRNVNRLIGTAARKKEFHVKQVVVSSLLLMALIVPAATHAMEEGPDRVIAATTGAAAQRSPLAQALHEARAAGDTDLVYSLTAQLRGSAAPVGESALAPFSPRISTTVNGHRDEIRAPEQLKIWGDDVKVSSPWPDDIERNPSMASDSAGNFYVVWQDDDEFTGDFWLNVWKSTDQGATWISWGSITNGSANLEDPSIAIGEDTSSRNLLLLAYTVDDGVDRYVEVATAPLDTGVFTIRSVTLPNWKYYRPVIWTDSYDWSAWYAYMTAEAEVDTATNRNVTFSRSTDGITWDSFEIPWGNFDAETWADPDGAYGTTGSDVFVVCYNETTDTLQYRRSTDLGATFEPAVEIASPDASPFRVNPDIEAATNRDNLFIGMTWRFVDSTTEDTAYLYSTDAGVTWTVPYNDLRDPSSFEESVEVTANEGGGSFHVAVTRGGDIYRASRPQDLTQYFSAIHDRITDLSAQPSGDYPKKGITSNWSTDHVGIARSDYRTGLPVYEIYYDFSDAGLFGDGFETGDTSAWGSTAP